MLPEEQFAFETWLGAEWKRNLPELQARIEEDWEGLVQALFDPLSTLQSALGKESHILTFSLRSEQEHREMTEDWGERPQLSYVPNETGATRITRAFRSAISGAQSVVSELPLSAPSDDPEDELRMTVDDAVGLLAHAASLARNFRWFLALAKMQVNGRDLDELLPALKTFEEEILGKL